MQFINTSRYIDTNNQPSNKLIIILIDEPIDGNHLLIVNSVYFVI